MEKNFLVKSNIFLTKNIFFIFFLLLILNYHFLPIISSIYFGESVYDLHFKSDFIIKKEILFDAAKLIFLTTLFYFILKIIFKRDLSKTNFSEKNSTSYIKIIISILGVTQLLIWFGIIPFPYSFINEEFRHHISIDYAHWPFYNPTYFSAIDNLFLRIFVYDFATITIPTGLYFLYEKLLRGNIKPSTFIYILLFLFYIFIDRRRFIISFIAPIACLLFLLDNKNFLIKHLISTMLILLMIYIFIPIKRDYSIFYYTQSGVERIINFYHNHTNYLCSYTNAPYSKICIYSENYTFQKLTKKNTIRLEEFEDRRPLFKNINSNSLKYLMLDRVDANHLNVKNSEESEIFIKKSFLYPIPKSFYKKITGEEKGEVLRTDKDVLGQKYHLSDPLSWLTFTKNMGSIDSIKTVVNDYSIFKKSLKLMLVLIPLIFSIILFIAKVSMNKRTFFSVIFIFSISYFLFNEFSIAGLVLSLRNYFIIALLFYILSILIKLKDLIIFNLK